MGKGRLEAFSDGVIAILITIMVLELRAPHGTDLAALRPLMPVFVSYLLSRDHLLALTLSRRDGLRAHDRGPGAAIDDAVAAYRTLLFRESQQPVWRLEGGSGFRASSRAMSSR